MGKGGKEKQLANTENESLLYIDHEPTGQKQINRQED
jgi:hypothetical protein